MGFVSLLVVNERKECKQTLFLLTGPLKTHSDLELVPKFEPIT